MRLHAVTQVEPVLGAGDPHVAEAPFFFELVGIAEAADVRETPRLRDR
jgi:hypothetical protein